MFQHWKIILNHPESTATTLNQTGREKIVLWLGWAILITDGLRIAHLRIAPQWAILRWAFLTFTVANHIQPQNKCRKSVKTVTFWYAWFCFCNTLCDPKKKIVSNKISETICCQARFGLTLFDYAWFCRARFWHRRFCDTFVFFIEHECVKHDWFKQ